jgi:hypothetical protein
MLQHPPAVDKLLLLLLLLLQQQVQLLHLLNFAHQLAAAKKCKTKLPLANQVSEPLMMLGLVALPPALDSPAVVGWGWVG